MALFLVDQEKCKRDGICVAECPLGIIEMPDQDSPPTPVPGAEELCLDCGHCVAVCPHGALTLATMAPEQCPPFDRKLLPEPRQLDHLLRARRSIRAYKQQEVEQQLLAELLDTARYAPSGSNRQPVRWLVANGASKVQQLTGLTIDWLRHLLATDDPLAKLPFIPRAVAAWEKGTDAVLRKAPALVIAHGLDDYPSARTDGAIALTYLELAAFSRGLGGCWAGLFHFAAASWPPLQEALALPREHSIFGAMMLGFPQYPYHRLPLRNQAEISWL